MTDSLRSDEVCDAAVQHVNEDGGQHQRQAVDDVRKLKWIQIIQTAVSVEMFGSPRERDKI